MQVRETGIEIVAAQRRFFQTGATREIAFRRQQLQALQQAIAAREEDIVAALHADLGKSKFEAIATEVAYCLAEIKYVLRHLAAWMKPKPVATPLALLPARSRIVPEPLGAVLIISPWNYPLQLAILPLIGAIAAGNCAIVKPSEISERTSQVIVELIGDTFAPEFVSAIAGGKEIAQALLAEKFDCIFYTGSTQVGKIVLRAAAETLTPVTLELGGKSPCIVARDADVSVSARRITWGKFINAGQTCTAPDYLLVQRHIKADLLAQITTCLQEFYGSDPAQSPDYGRIVSDRHWLRLNQLLECGQMVVGGDGDRERRYLAPTVVQGVSWDDPAMQEEIFGPILPVLEFEDLEEAIAQVNARPKPLALYIFSKSPQVQSRILHSTSSGGVCINDTVIHVASPYLPFGGLGESGMGDYHGKASFETFSHYKSTIENFCFVDIKLRYPPYRGKLGWVRRLLGG